MVARQRSNPLALAVLVSLHERPMHPYEISSLLRERSQHESVRLNFGSLYAVVAALARRGLIEPVGSEREGHLPERTVYRLTEIGSHEARDWLSAIVSTPVNDYPALGAGLALLPALEPSAAVRLLRERAARLAALLEDAQACRARNELASIPRLIWVGDEYRATMLGAELAYVESLAAAIESRSLEGLEWWEGIHTDAPARADASDAR